MSVTGRSEEELKKIDKFLDDFCERVKEFARTSPKPLQYVQLNHAVHEYNNTTGGEYGPPMNITLGGFTIIFSAGTCNVQQVIDYLTERHV